MDTFRGNLPSPRCAHALAAPQGGRLLYLFGGIVRPPSSPASLAVDNGLYVYDPVLGTVTAAGPGAAIPTNGPPAPRAVFGFAAIGSLLYVFGGADQYNAKGACVGRRNATQDEGRKHATHRAGSTPLVRNANVESAKMRAVGSVNLHDFAYRPPDSWLSAAIFVVLLTRNALPPPISSFPGFDSPLCCLENLMRNAVFASLNDSAGGVSSSSGPHCFNDLYSFDTVANQWSTIVAASPPSPRCGHGFATAGGTLYVFGGASCSGALWRCGGEKSRRIFLNR